MRLGPRTSPLTDTPYYNTYAVVFQELALDTKLRQAAILRVAGARACRSRPRLAGTSPRRRGARRPGTYSLRLRTGSSVVVLPLCARHPPFMLVLTTGH